MVLRGRLRGRVGRRPNNIRTVRGLVAFMRSGLLLARSFGTVSKHHG